MMLSEYKDIIERRRKWIQKVLMWDRDFVTELKRSKLLDKPTFADIEAESPDDAKTGMLLDALTRSQLPGAFNVFLEVINSSGQRKLLRTLHDDRYKIVWDFQMENHSSNYSDCIAVMEDQLLKRYEKEEDPYLRDLIWDEFCARISKMKGKLREQRNERKNLRQDLIAALPDSQLIQGQLSDLDTAKLLLEDKDTRSDRIVLNETIAVIGELNKQIQHLREDVDTQNDSKRKNVLESLLKSSDLNSQKSKVEMLSNMVKEQDIKIVRLQDDIYANQKQNVSIRRTEMSIILDLIQSHLPKHKRKTDVADDNVAKAIKKHADQLLKENAKSEEKATIFKKRVGQIGNRVTELELERETLAKMLDVSPTSSTPLQDVLCSKLKEYEEDKENMEKEMESMQNRISQLAEENRAIGLKLFENKCEQNKDSNGRKLSIGGIPGGTTTGGRRHSVCPGQLASVSTPRRRMSVGSPTPAIPKSTKSILPGIAKTRRASAMSVVTIA